MQKKVGGQVAPRKETDHRQPAHISKKRQAGQVENQLQQRVAQPGRAVLDLGVEGLGPQLIQLPADLVPVGGVQPSHLGIETPLDQQFTDVGPVNQPLSAERLQRLVRTGVVRQGRQSGAALLEPPPAGDHPPDLGQRVAESHQRRQTAAENGQPRPDCHQPPDRADPPLRQRLVKPHVHP